MGSASWHSSNVHMVQSSSKRLSIFYRIFIILSEINQTRLNQETFTSHPAWSQMISLGIKKCQHRLQNRARCCLLWLWHILCGGWGALIKHRASSVAPLTMCFQLRAASDHSGGFVQTQGSQVTEKQREGGKKRRLCQKTVKSCIKFESIAVNKEDESQIGAREEPCSLLLGLESTTAWLWH